MEQTAIAVYERGILRLLTPLDLPENARVSVQVQPAPPEGATEHRQRVHAALVAAGLALPEEPAPPPGDLLSEAERAELAQRLADLGPISDLIIEERAGR